MARTVSTTNGRLEALGLKSTNQRIFRALFSLASAALLIRVIGLLNQVVVTQRFGAGAQMDAYFVASAWPLFIGQLIVSALEAAVIPVYTRVRMGGTKEQTSVLFSTLLHLIIMGLLLLVVVMLIFRQQVIFLSAPGLKQASAQLATDLTPFIFPGILLTVVIGYLESIFNTEGQFGWPAYAGMLVPLTSAILVLVVDNSQGVVILCISMLIGLGLQLCAFIVRARLGGIIYRPALDLRTPEIHTILLAAWPVLLGGLVTQAGPLVDQIFASSLPSGSISALSYSLKLVSVPIGVIFVTVGRAILPFLSRQASARDMNSFKKTLRLYLWIVGVGTLVLSAVMIALAHPLVQILFERGQFSDNAANLTAKTLMGLLVGLPPMSIVFIMSRAFSAIGKNKILMRTAVFTVVSNAIFDAIFAHFWQSLGIALATSAVYFGLMLIMLFTLRHMIGELNLFTFPPEIKEALREIVRRKDQNFPGSDNWREINLSSLGISYALQKQITRIGIALAVFAVGVAGVIISSTYTLRAALGSGIIVILMRYRYLLLIAWILINALNALPIFRGSNILIGLTVPTLLLMAYLPVVQTFKRLPALACLLIYLLWVFAGIGISSIGVGNFLTIWVEMVDCLCVGVLVIDVLTTKRRLLVVIDFILLLAGAISLYGIYGYFTKQNGIPDAVTPGLYRIGSIFGFDQNGIQIFATGGGGPQTLGLFLSTIVPLALYRMFTVDGFRRIVVLLSIFILIIALGLTVTRGAYISLPLSIVIMALVLPSRKMKIGIIGAVMVVILVMVILSIVGNFPFLSRFFRQDITTLNGRTYLWGAILANVDPMQLLGHGLRASDVLLTSLHIGVNHQGLIGTSPHNLYLGTLFDHGIIGLGLLALIFIVLSVNLITVMRNTPGDRQMLCAAALAVLVSVLVQSIETNDFWTQAYSIYFWVIVSLPFALCWYAPKPLSKIDVVDFDEEATVPRIKAIQHIKPVYPSPV